MSFASRLLSAHLAAIGLIAPIGATARPASDDVAQAADELLFDLHRRGLFNGAVVLGRSGEEIYSRGFGPANLEAAVAFTPDTPADAASIAKTFTATAILMLIDEGRLSLDEPVQRQLPEYPHPETRVRDLLAHSSGLPEAGYDFFEGLVPDGVARTTPLFLQILRERRVAPEFAPGTRFRYSSLGYDVAAMLAARVAGSSFGELLKRRCFEPLGLDSTFLRPARFADWLGVRTLSYRFTGDSLELHDVWDNEGFHGGSNIYASARDLYRWSRSFYSAPVLSRPALALGAQAPELRDPATGLGGPSALNLGNWYYAASGRRYHYPGAIQGFWSSVYRDEEQRHSVVYVSNNSMPQWLRPLLTRALIEIVEGRRPAPIVRPDLVDLGADNLGPLPGTYSVAGVGAVLLEARGGRVFLRVGDGIEYAAYFVGGGQLYVPGLDVWIGLLGDRDSQPRRLSWLSIFTVSEGEPAAAGTDSAP